ncbi:MAG: zinc ribbon domain-containing protein [Ruminococcaceae bacterium]|nr:zinc ribbon domain-containing protein [Oscillospiraceae bacterium]
MSRFCRNCGSPVSQDTRFCTACGAGIQPSRESPEKDQPLQAATAQPTGVKALFAERLHQIKRSIAEVLKHPQKLIPLLVLVVVWLVLALLPALGINPQSVRWLSFLTFAQGGMFGGIWSIFGGVIGKAVFAYFVSAMLMPLFAGKNPFKGMGQGFKRFISGLAVQSASAGAHLLLGSGLALIVFNFLSGNASTINSMIGIAGFVLAIRGLWSRGGFFWGLLLSAAHKLTRGRIPSQIAVNHVIAGYAAGSALSVALSAVLTPFRLLTAYQPYLAGGVLLVTGLVLHFTIKAGKVEKPV